MFLGKKNNSDNENNLNDNDFENLDTNDLNNNNNLDNNDILSLYDDDENDEILYRDEDKDIENVVNEAKKLNSMKDVKISEIGYSDDDEESEDLIDEMENIADLIGTDDDESENNNDDDNGFENISILDDGTSDDLKGKKRDKRSRKNKRKNKEKDPGFISIDTDSMIGGDDFIIIEDNKKHFRGIKSTFKVIFSIIIFILLTIIVYISLSFKFIPENIKGSDYRIKNYSIISSSYKPNLDELKQGDEVICIKNESKFPFVLTFNKYVCQSRNGFVIFVTDESGKKLKIEANDINYIVK